VTSPSVPADRRSDLAEFLRQKDARDRLASAGGRKTSQEHALTPDLRRLWINSCNECYGDASLPDPDRDAVVSCESVVRFPGLQLTSTVYVGAKLRCDAGMPEHEFVLIAEQQRLEGPPPMVWMYRKLTGMTDHAADSSNDGTTPQPSKGHSKSRVSVVELDDGQSLALSLDTNLQIRVDFPSFLIRVLPASKERMEEQGSAAVLRAVSKDVVDAGNSTWDAFLRGVP
jgi:hypothetical protein